MQSFVVTFVRVAPFVLALSVVSGCGSCGSGNRTDSGNPGTDATEPDGGGTDAANPDSGTDLGTPCCGPDSGTDGGTDGGTDSGMPMLGVTGEPCGLPTDCAPAATTGMPMCISDIFGFPGGYCSNENCDPLLTGDCPGDGVCETTMGGAACLDACDPLAPDCRPGYTCFDASQIFGGATRHYCLPFCETDADCDMASGEQCDNMGGMASFTCYTPGAAVGDPCDDGNDCGVGGICLAEELFGFPAGYCSEQCNPLMMGTCPSGATCMETDAPDSGLCLDDCMNNTQCRGPYECRNTWYGTTLPNDVCLPACTMDSECVSPGLECEIGVGVCQLPVDPVAFGGPCADDADCPGGGCMREEDSGNPMGLCVDECDPSGADPDDCPMNGTCVDLTAFIGLGLCYETCDPLTPVCRPGYTCPNIGLITDVCIGDCQASSECSSSCCEMSMNPFGGNQCVDPAAMPSPMCI